jgi:hypothetical protein
MKSTLASLVLLLLLGTLIAPPASAQAPKAQLFTVTDVQVKPAKASIFEAGVKRQIELAYPGVFYASNTDDFHYYFVEPIANYAGIDTLNFREAAWMNGAGKDNIAALMKSLEGAIYHFDTYVFLQDPDLSYWPAKPRLKEGESKFVYWGFAYVEWGKEKEFEDIFKQWVALYKSKDVTSGWETYVGKFGADLPVYVWDMAGKSAADFFTEDENITKLLGEEAVKTLNEKTMACFRKFEFKTGRFRPDLSNLPKRK